MHLPAKHRRHQLVASVTFGIAILATAVACGTNRTTAPRAPSLLLVGTWEYNALQPVGFGGAFVGIVAIDSLSADNGFTGAFEGQISDSSGVKTQVTAVITGRKTDTTSITFTFVTPTGDTIVNSGTQISDTLQGEWANRRAIQVGSFTMVRESSPSDPNNPRVISRRPRRP